MPMNISVLMVVVLFAGALVGVGILGGLLLLYRHNYNKLFGSMKYMLNFIKVVETDILKLKEDVYLIKEYLHRKGLLDEEDLDLLRKELIEKPRQLEAEKEELLAKAVDQEREGKVIKNTPDTLH